MIRLLDKKKITSDQNAQNKSIIDEGVRLAHLVENLRQDLLSLEKQRADFIAGSAMELKKAIGGLEDRKRELETEIEQALGQLKELRKPLDEEWKKIFDKQVSLNKELAQVADEKDELKKKTTIIEEKEKRTNATEITVAEEKRLVGSLRRQAEGKLGEATRVLDSARRESERQTADFLRERAEIAKEREQNAIDAKDNARDKEINGQRNIKLDEKERAINDKYETLLATINTLKK